MPFNGSIIYDFDNLCYPIPDYISGYAWGASFDVTGLSSGDQLSADMSIIDSLGNVIKSGGISTVPGVKNTKEVNLSAGDLDYDEMISTCV